MLNLVLDNQQREHKKLFKVDDIIWQEYENTEDMGMQRSEDIWQTAKELESYICQHKRFELPRDTHQQPENGTKTSHHSALFLFSSRNKISEHLCKFQKNIKAWFTSGGCMPHYS